MDSDGNLDEDFVNSTESIEFTDNILPLFALNETSIANYTINGTEYLFVVAPMVFELNSMTDDKTHCFSVGVAMPYDTTTSVIENIDIFSDSSVQGNLIFLGIFIAITFLISAIIAYSTSHYIIRPLRELNSKMKDIIITTQKSSSSYQAEGDLNDEGGGSSQELTDLYNVFKNLISTKKFENNDFMNKPDALAVVDLAEACNMFDGSNY